MSTLEILAVSLPATIAVIVVSSLVFARKVLAVVEDNERCEAIRVGGQRGARRCVYRVRHFGPHHCPEDKHYYDQWWEDEPGAKSNAVEELT